MTVTCPKCEHTFSVSDQPRSTPQNRRQFGIYRAAFDNWREDHRFKPQSSEHLRHWLEKEAGHYETVLTTERINGAPDQLYDFAVQLLQSAKEKRVFIEMSEDIVVVKRTLSISYARLSHKAACDLFNKIGEIIWAEIGIDPQELLEGHQRAA